MAKMTIGKALVMVCVVASVAMMKGVGKVGGAIARSVGE